ncbi:helix-turn-helix domain-containing protein [Yimella sp. cx-51]|uniref:helix-turn-helix domain-containing protein n=1 Tax=Yimella sp. cx-51 TaxID=2770551 RepID=UPI00165E7B9F|nr:helix-turn-helix domain-containing protein [Yimella sp. cx-51]MBC9955553.1 helix-turn-helix domain-containing protein [Yimella sp. cx-51]QTH37868.1 helix-turn-helix domain-containing protein [Yimella sp. cx-51]
MGRPPVIPAEKKTRIVMSVLAGEMTIAEAARKEKISEQSIGRWKADFLEAGKTALAAGRSGPSTREQQLEAEVADLTQTLGEAAVELRVWKKSAEGRLGALHTCGGGRCSGWLSPPPIRSMRRR